MPEGFPTWHDQPFRKTHNIEEVGLACIALDLTLTDVVREAGVLSAFAWRLRYPGSGYAPESAESTEMWKLARLVLEAVKTRVPPVE